MNQTGKFKYGTSEFQSYWLPMILFTSVNEANQDVAHMMVFKYRKPCLTKEEAANIAEFELNLISSSVSEIRSFEMKAKQIIDSIKLLHYYPSPEYSSNWESEWNIAKKERVNE